MPVRLVTRLFSEMSANELYDYLKLRSQVFVVEQNCVFLDMDDLDQENRCSVHVLAYDETNGSRLVGCLRVVRPGFQCPERLGQLPSLGRIVVDINQRKQGLGKLLVEAGLAHVAKQYGAEQPIHIMAQTAQLSFYKGCGFNTIAGEEEFLEDDIPHVHMLLKR